MSILAENGRSLDELLRDAGYSHCRLPSFRHGLYRHAVWRTEDGALVGYMDAAEACQFLKLSREQEDRLAPRVTQSFGGHE